MPSHLWHCYLPLPKQVTSHANNSDEALQQCQLLSQLLLELLVALLPLRIVAYGILRQMVSSSALKHQFLSWNMWGKKVRWTHGNKTKQRNTGSLHPWCNPWCNPYWPPLGCERQKSTVQFPLYIRKLGACPKQAFLPSTLSGSILLHVTSWQFGVCRAILFRRVYLATPLSAAAFAAAFAASAKRTAWYTMHIIGSYGFQRKTCKCSNYM